MEPQNDWRPLPGYAHMGVESENEVEWEWFSQKNMGTKTMKQQLTLSFRWDEHDQHQQPVNMYCCCWPIYTKINWSNQGRVTVRRVTYPMLSCLPRSTQICWDWPSFRWSMESVPVQWWWRTGHHPACHCCQSKGRRNCLQIPTRPGRAVKPRHQSYVWTTYPPAIWESICGSWFMICQTFFDLTHSWKLLDPGQFK